MRRLVLALRASRYLPCSGNSHWDNEERLTVEKGPAVSYRMRRDASMDPGICGGRDCSLAGDVCNPVGCANSFTKDGGKSALITYMPVRQIGERWMVDFHFGGERCRRRSPLNTAEAALAYEMFLKKEAGLYGSITAAIRANTPHHHTPCPKLREFAPRWFAGYVAVNNRPKEQQLKRIIFERHILPDFGSERLCDIGHEEIERYKGRKRAAGFAAKTINNHLAVLHRCLTSAKEWSVLRTDVPRVPLRVAPLVGVHVSRAGFTSKDPRELEADQFSVGLLMPRALFHAEMGGAGEGLGAVEGLARACRTSLTATAIRLADLTDEALAIVVCDQDEIVFSRMSQLFRELPDLTPLRAKTPIPRRTATSSLVADPRRIIDRDRIEELTPLRAWFGSGPDIHLFEQVLGLGRYGRVLTVLTPEEPHDHENSDEEAALLTSWTPTLGKKTRRR